MYQHIEAKDLDIRLDTSDQRFYFNVKGARDAQLEYDLHTEGKRNVLELTSVHVPEHLEPTDIKNEMTMTAVKHADKNGYLVKPSAPFTKSWMNRHQEFNYLRAKKRR
jgi:predicted GNAT family acetyltransferase